jgi:hypothetical protein
VCGAQVQNFELQELKTTLEVSARQIGDLQTQLTAQKAQSQTLSQSLVAANAESASSRESLEKLRGLLEGLGIGALEGGSNQVQERLLASLSDMKLLDEQKKKLTEALLTLSEATVAYAKVTPSGDADTSKALEAAVTVSEHAIRTAGSAGTIDAQSADLHNVKIVSVKPETGVAVLNVGARDGVKVGMPFAVYRNDHSIAKLLVVDVRKSVAGAVIQETTNTKESIQVGDRGVIDTDRSF